MAETLSHWTRDATVWLEPRIVSLTWLYALMLRERDTPAPVYLADYMSPHRAAEDLRRGVFDQEEFRPSAYRIPIDVRDWNGLR